MTLDGPVGEILRADRVGLGPAAEAIATVCDAVLGEVGRRQHRFSWLRRADGNGATGATGAVRSAEPWLPVDAYYPSHRLVLLLRERDGRDRGVEAERILGHGLAVLVASPAELPVDRVELHAVMRARLEVTLRAVPAGARTITAAAARETTAAPRATPPSHGQTAGSTRGRTGGRAAHPTTLGAVLVLVPLSELSLAVLGVALSGGQIVLALGLVFDAAARLLGGVPSARAGDPSAGWRALVLGSLEVVTLAPPGSVRRVDVEPAPLASVLAGGALVLVVLGLGLALLGG